MAALDGAVRSGNPLRIALFVLYSNFFQFNLFYKKCQDIFRKNLKNIFQTRIS